MIKEGDIIRFCPYNINAIKPDFILHRIVKIHSDDKVSMELLEPYEGRTVGTVYEFVGFSQTKRIKEAPEANTKLWKILNA